MHTWLVRSSGDTIRVDTGISIGKTLPALPQFHHLDLPYLDQLLAAGVQPEEVDFVLMTHLHLDHVGWNTRYEDERWVPTFPNAKYIFSPSEQRYDARLSTHKSPPELPTPSN